MKRKDFLKKAILSSIAAITVPAVLKADNVKEITASTYDKLMDNVGYNHMPNQEVKTANTVLHKAATRGNANHGWLNANHSFSFANYQNPDRMHFGALRVLNDDIIAGGRGFSTHPHDNMEIITIPLSGGLEHKDNMGNGTVIKAGDVQAMSAGTGITHSEFNANKNEEVKLLQIWLFPNRKGATPRYDQITVKDIEKKNEFNQILSPNKNDQGVWINQNAWFHMGEFTTKKNINYTLKDKSNGVYAFIIEGNANINGQAVNKRDGFGIWNTDKIEISAEANAKILLLEVPMYG
jgi:hypothetical protein